MTISAIEETKRGRFSLFSDGEFLFSVCKDTYINTELAPGAELSPERLEEIRLLDETGSAKEKALTLLSYSALSAGMLREKLRRHYGAEAAEAAVTRMGELGLIDDADYAARLAADMQHLRGYSLRRIRFELEKRHIAREVINGALADFSPAGEADAIAEIVRKKYRGRLSEADGARKVYAALLRQGFSNEDIKEGLRRAQEDTQEDEQG